jgi:hypothetical protein
LFGHGRGQQQGRRVRAALAVALRFGSAVGKGLVLVGSMGVVAPLLLGSLFKEVVHMCGWVDVFESLCPLGEGCVNLYSLCHRFGCCLSCLVVLKYLFVVSKKKRRKKKL